MKYCGVQRRGGRRGSKRLSDLDSIAKSNPPERSDCHRGCGQQSPPRLRNPRSALRTVDRRDTPARGMRDVASEACQRPQLAVDEGRRRPCRSEATEQRSVAEPRKTSRRPRSENVNRASYGPGDTSHELVLAARDHRGGASRQPNGPGRLASDEREARGHGLPAAANGDRPADGGTPRARGNVERTAPDPSSDSAFRRHRLSRHENLACNRPGRDRPTRVGPRDREPDGERLARLRPGRRDDAPRDRECERGLVRERVPEERSVIRSEVHGQDRLGGGVDVGAEERETEPGSVPGSLTCSSTLTTFAALRIRARVGRWSGRQLLACGSQRSSNACRSATVTRRSAPESPVRAFSSESMKTTNAASDGREA